MLRHGRPVTRPHTQGQSLWHSHSRGENVVSATLVSIQVGLPLTLDMEGTENDNEKQWWTGSYKEAVEGPIWLGSTNLVGDGQADTVNHGGPDKAVCVYSVDHYPAWRVELCKPNFGNGAFGENFSVAGLSEEGACIGDVFAVGNALVQVSQPRIPCWKLARRWAVNDMTARVQETGRTGWYLRVLHEGYVEAGMHFVLVERPFPQWTISTANRILQQRDDLKGTTDLASCDLLAAVWRKMLLKRVAVARACSGELEL